MVASGVFYPEAQMLGTLPAQAVARRVGAIDPQTTVLPRYRATAEHMLQYYPRRPLVAYALLTILMQASLVWVLAKCAWTSATPLGSSKSSSTRMVSSSR